MTMEKGLAVIEVNETGTKGFYIDQDALDFARLNARADKHRKEATNAQKKADRNRSKAEKANAKRKAYTLKTFSRILANCGICCASAWAGIAGMIHPAIFIPVCLFCLCVACIRFGAWYGKVVK